MSKVSRHSSTHIYIIDVPSIGVLESLQSTKQNDQQIKGWGTGGPDDKGEKGSKLESAPPATLSSCPGRTIYSGLTVTQLLISPTHKLQFAMVLETIVSWIKITTLGKNCNFLCLTFAANSLWVSEISSNSGPSKNLAGSVYKLRTNSSAGLR